MSRVNREDVQAEQKFLETIIGEHFNKMMSILNESKDNIKKILSDMNSFINSEIDKIDPNDKFKIDRFEIIRNMARYLVHENDDVIWDIEKTYIRAIISDYEIKKKKD
jgi:hypothetical protein